MSDEIILRISNMRYQVLSETGQRAKYLLVGPVVMHAIEAWAARQAGLRSDERYIRSRRLLNMDIVEVPWMEGILPLHELPPELKPYAG